MSAELIIYGLIVLLILIFRKRIWNFFVKNFKENLAMIIYLSSIFIMCVVFIPMLKWFIQISNKGITNSDAYILIAPLIATIPISIQFLLQTKENSKTEKLEKLNNKLLKENNDLKKKNSILKNNSKTNTNENKKRKR